jgi:predicted RNA-binding protein YlxR (DUF448 family)
MYSLYHTYPFLSIGGLSGGIAVGALEKCEKKDLLRVVRDNSGNVFVDETGRANGRGAYLKKSKEALEIARKKKSLARALECDIPESVYQEIENIIG